VDLLLALLFVISSWFVWRARWGAGRGDQRVTVSNLPVTTLVLGVLALIGVVYVWASLDFTSGSRFQDTYLIATLYHSVHLISGDIALLALRLSARKGRYSPENHWVVEAGALFWSLVVLAWLGLFVVFYLL
jgi:cytochrome c oxidase subunit 3